MFYEEDEKALAELVRQLVIEAGKLSDRDITDFELRTTHICVWDSRTSIEVRVAVNVYDEKVPF